MLLRHIDVWKTKSLDCDVPGWSEPVCVWRGGQTASEPLLQKQQSSDLLQFHCASKHSGNAVFKNIIYKIHNLLWKLVLETLTVLPGASTCPLTRGCSFSHQLSIRQHNRSTPIWLVKTITVVLSTGWKNCQIRIWMESGSFFLLSLLQMTVDRLGGELFSSFFLGCPPQTQYVGSGCPKHK